MTPDLGILIGSHWFRVWGVIILAVYVSVFAFGFPIRFLRDGPFCFCA